MCVFELIASTSMVFCLAKNDAIEIQCRRIRVDLAVVDSVRTSEQCQKFSSAASQKIASIRSYIESGLNTIETKVSSFAFLRLSSVCFCFILFIRKSTQNEIHLTWDYWSISPKRTFEYINRKMQQQNLNELKINRKSTLCQYEFFNLLCVCLCIGLSWPLSTLADRFYWKSYAHRWKQEMNFKIDRNVKWKVKIKYNTMTSMSDKSAEKCLSNENEMTWKIFLCSAQTLNNELERFTGEFHLLFAYFFVPSLGTTGDNSMNVTQEIHCQVSLFPAISHLISLLLLLTYKTIFDDKKRRKMKKWMEWGAKNVFQTNKYQFYWCEIWSDAK